MLYDLADGPPEPGSLLESVLMVLCQRRMRAQYLQTSALVSAILAPHSGGEGLEDTLRAYADAMFPYVSAQRAEKERYEKEALKHWTEKKVFSVKPLWRAHDDRRVVSRLRRGAERLKRMEEERRSMKVRRI